MGVAGLAVVGHGRSSVKAIRNAIVMASRFVSTDFVKRVEEEVSVTVQGR
jgi:fatty acid/phospholipid biosynthesis enzyme